MAATSPETVEPLRTSSEKLFPAETLERMPYRAASSVPLTCARASSIPPIRTASLVFDTIDAVLAMSKVVKPEVREGALPPRTTAPASWFRPTPSASMRVSPVELNWPPPTYNPVAPVPEAVTVSWPSILVWAVATLCHTDRTSAPLVRTSRSPATSMVPADRMPLTPTPNEVRSASTSTERVVPAPTSKAAPPVWSPVLVAVRFPEILAEVPSPSSKRPRTF